MGSTERITHLASDRNDAGKWQWTRVTDHLLECLPAQVLHYEKHDAILVFTKSVTLNAFGCEMRRPHVLLARECATIFSSAVRTDVRLTATVFHQNMSTTIDGTHSAFAQARFNSIFSGQDLARSESEVVSRATPSAGQRVVASGYSMPHFGHVFIWPHMFCQRVASANTLTRLIKQRREEL